MVLITRICSFALACVATASAALAGSIRDTSTEANLYWDAQRADLLGKPEIALKNYNRLLGKLPESTVLVDRLYDVAVINGDFPSALKAARAQQLNNGGDAALPLIFFVDAWKRGDWKDAHQATQWLKDRNIFGFLSPIFEAWLDVAQGKSGTIANAALRDSSLLYYYSFDQLIFLDLANGHVEDAQRRLSSFPGFGDDYGRQMAMTAAEHLGHIGQSEYANSLLQHLGVEPIITKGKQGKFPAEQALASLFSRLSDQLEEQGIYDQSLYFARLANWVAPENVFGRMTLAKRMSENNQAQSAALLLDGISPSRPQWSWVEAAKVRLMAAENRPKDVLVTIQGARRLRPKAQDLILLEAQHLDANHEMVAATRLYKKLIADVDASGARNGQRVAYRQYLAQSLQAQGLWSEAKSVLEEALALNSENPQILKMLGSGLVVKQEDVKRGLDLLSKAHRLVPQSADITDSLAWGHYLNGDYETAVPLLELAVEGAYNDVATNEHLGDAYWQTGRVIDARYAWRSALLQAKGEAADRILAKVEFGWTQATAAP